MAHLPFAFSVSHFINSVGADAGFASIIGLAILVLLYFAQARETSTLRDRADEAEQRAGALEARLAQVTRAQSAPQPAAGQRPPASRPLVNPAPGTVTASRGPGTVPAAAAAAAMSPVAAVAFPSAPAGLGGPALSSATRLIPVSAPAPVEEPREGPARTPAEVAAQSPAGAPAQSPAGAPALAPGGAPALAPGGAPAQGPAQAPGGPSPERPGAAPVAAPRPATVAAQAAAAPVAAAGATAVFAGATRADAPARGTNGTAEHGEEEEYSDEFPAVGTQAPEPQPLPRVALRPGGSGPVRPSQASIRRPSAPRGGSRLGRGFAVLLGVLGVAAIAAVLLIVTSGGGGKTASTSSTPTTNTPSTHHRTNAKAFVPSNVSVGVLNGTAQAGLAAKVMTQLAAVGYKQGITPSNAANQTQATTVVAYLPGQRAAAVHVAKSLKLSTSAVQPIDSQTQQLACPQAASCAVSVVVTVGQDLSGG